jgi:hypothetical protein
MANRYGRGIDILEGNCLSICHALFSKKEKFYGNYFNDVYKNI